MVFEAVFHSTGSEYCHAIDIHTIVIRLRAKRGDLTRCVVCYGDRVYPREVVRVDAVEMSVVASDSCFDYFEAIIKTDLTRVCYYFILSDGKMSVYYYGNAFHQKLGHNRNQYYQLSYIRQEDIVDVPEWAKSAVIYQVFPDSFATGRNYIAAEGKTIPMKWVTDSGICTAEHIIPFTAIQMPPNPPGSALGTGAAANSNHIFCKSDQGGTLRGIIENLPYLKRLGINCLYLTPIFTAGEYHKYDTIDYFSVDPCFGDLKTLKELVKKCHGLDIRVILDGVFNHCGADFFAFRDVLEKGEQSRYKDWFFIKDYPVCCDKQNYECFAYVSSMPKLNTGNPEVMAYFIDVGTYWIKEADIDGWRLDVANEVNHDFWRAFRKAVRDVKPDAFLIGEIWFDAREWLMGDQFDSVMNYGFMDTCADFFAKGIINVKQFDDRMSYLRMRYKKDIQQVQMNLIDSHDVPRFLSKAGGDIRKLKLAVLFMMTHVGIPTVYYGDEKGLDGLCEKDYRKPMQWGESETSNQLFEFYQKLITIRKEHMDLMTGDYITIDRELVCNTIVYFREANGKRLFVIINNSESVVQYTLDVRYCKKGESRPELPDKHGYMAELISGKTYMLEGNAVTVTLEPLSGMILKRIDSLSDSVEKEMVD